MKTARIIASLAMWITFAVVLTGCVGGYMAQKHPDGSRTSAFFARIFASTDEYKCAISQTNATVEAKKSKVDGNALGTAAGTAGKILIAP
jgi:hypothetical protein